MGEATDNQQFCPEDEEQLLGFPEEACHEMDAGKGIPIERGS
jgi:hypothetical protein